MRRAALVTVLLAWTVAVGCADKKPTAACTTYVVPAGTDLTHPLAQFRRDVIPVLKLSCTFASCHGGRAGDLTMTDTDPGGTHAALVGVTSPENPTMKLVAPGDPANSYLMHKIDGDNCTLKAECTNRDCGDTMPQQSDLIDVPRRDTIRRWIAQGAKND